MSNVPIKEIMIIGPNIPDSELHKLSSQEGVLCIGDGKSEITAALIKEKLQGIMLADKFRVDINAHGNRDNQKQQIIWLNSFPLKTEDFLKVFKTLLTHDSGKQELTGEWHLWSCFGGSTNKATHILGKNNSLITHIDSKNPSNLALTNYTIKKSIENYLENPKKEPYQRWIEDQKYSFQTSTFNFNPTSGPNYTTHLKSARTLKPEILKDIVKKFKHTNDLTAVFTDFIAEDIRKIENSKEFRMLKAQGYFKTNFKASDEIKIELSNEEAKNLALGIAIYLSNTIKDQNLDIFKEYIHNIKQHGVDLDSNVLGIPPLFMAAGEGHIEIVKELIVHGANVNQADAQGTPPLFIAAQEGYIEIVKELLTHGVDADLISILCFQKTKVNIDTPAKDGSTLLLRAIKNEKTEIVEALLMVGADPSKANSKDGTTPLQAAMSTKNKDIINLITNYALKGQSIINTPTAVPSTHSKNNSKTMGIP